MDELGVKFTVGESELGDGGSIHVHDGLHVRLEDGRHDRCVHLIALGRLKLHLIDVTIVVANGARCVKELVLKNLNEWDHVGAQFYKALLHSSINFGAGASLEKSALIEAGIVFHQLPQGIEACSKLQQFFALRVFEVILIDFLAGYSIADVDYMLSNHIVNFDGKNFIFFGFFRLFARLDSLVEFKRVASCPECQGVLKEPKVTKILLSCFTLCKQGISSAKVGEEIAELLSLQRLLAIFEQELGALLVHEHVHALICRCGSTVGPPGRQA